MHITVCICTYKRPRLLKRLLETLVQQDTQGQFTYSVVVADNDSLESARETVAAATDVSPVRITYCVEPRQNIALVRNRAVAAADGDTIAFIDDDEFPTKDWLRLLRQTLVSHRADGVLGPVKPFFESAPPAWLLRGRFCDRPEHLTGTMLPWQQTRTGNVLFDRRILKRIGGEPFRSQFGNGSEDTDFFRRMIQAGCVFVWCNEASVYEVVPPERWTRSYYFKRALLQGQNQRHVADLQSISKSLIILPVYSALIPLLLFAGQHRWMKYSIKLLHHVGKLLAVAGLKPLGEKYLTT